MTWRPTVEELEPLTFHRLRSMTADPAATEQPAITVQATLVPASRLLPHTGVIMLQCPGCGRRTRALFQLSAVIACRRCLKVPYQSQTHGRWTGPMLIRMSDRLQALRQRPGPKGRRYRAWGRRVARAYHAMEVWEDAFVARWASSSPSSSPAGPLGFALPWGLACRGTARRPEPPLQDT
jgi:hypothetical protein